jgi:DNA-binding MarR family transcriptional regulator
LANIVIVNNNFSEQRMARTRSIHEPVDPSDGLAFLLSQVGFHASARFAARLEPLRVKPPHVGILRVVEQADGLSQQALCERLGVFPSRLVALIDELERLGLVERRNSPSDRRSRALHLTEEGRKTLRKIDRVSGEHQEAICHALDADERAQLADFLRRIVTEQGLSPGVHPGFRSLDGGGAKSCS